MKSLCEIINVNIFMAKHERETLLFVFAQLRMPSESAITATDHKRR
ncbi:hypothetical protein [Parageobacillus thermoglucosidasius]|uniref:Uncharacterized protein n=1 Tax=Geobacillus sp. (strain Y4.1MC1) TaxID=581103 RepID=A0A7U3YDX8_GEOS0|nr:hypothetical protein [Parageobacillus thermoglucosidasius]KYD13765.1 hypothetical protein B4168_0586 [Anoxybacillus flavithermus]AEH47205.1 hypothetical protein Geoth_1210 [Parageobacillus thermoglucosidasius C56-YS93]MED4905131.1 hypothetical protein [Parageobacillus thermoglucosidasius]MED4913356.1 hypothetical protein [Parageobacillus thermoglucosidasius]MED4944605.1 hypothetical protein [Parageobacillus thermoglucosidasius]